MIAAGADKVYLGSSAELELYQPEIYTAMIVDLARERQPAIMLMGSTFMGRELAPLVAARLQTGLTAHCTDLVLAENKILETKIPAYGGLLSIICPQKRPQMATIAQGVFPNPELDETRTGEIIQLNVPADIPRRIETLEVVREATDSVPLEFRSPSLWPAAPAPVIRRDGAGLPNWLKR